MSFLLGTSAPRERRALFAAPPIPPNSATGVGYARVDLSRTESSLQKVAVWACVNLIATLAEVMPLHRYAGDDKTPLPLPGWLADLGGDGHGIPDWLYQYVYSAMLRGNSVGLVGDRDGRMGTPTLIVLQHPDLVRLRQDSDGTVEWRVNGQQVPTSQVWHRRVHPVPGQVMGLSPIEMHALTIGTGIAALRFGAQWFEDGAHPSGILTSEQRLDQTQASTAKQRFVEALRGRREPVVLGSGWKYETIQIAPNESQFLETNQYTGTECCRIFGPGFAQVLGYETGGSLTYSTLEQASLSLLTYAADPWLVRIERVLSGLLPAAQFVRFERGALLRTDLLTRFRAHEIAIRNDFETINEVRDLEDREPVPWGNEPRPNKTAAPVPVTVDGGQ